jgi:hypothetical protein
MLLSLALAFQMAAADKSGRLSGSVINLTKDKSEITVRQGTAARIVEFTNATTFTAGSPSNSKVAAPASFNDVNLGNYLTCTGAWDGVKLAATACTIRPSKKP